MIKSQSASRLIFIGIIFLMLFGMVSLGVYTENSLIDSLDMVLIEVIQSNVTESKTILLSILSEVGNIRLVIVLTLSLVIFLFVKEWYVASLWFGGTVLCFAAIGTKLFKMAIDRTRPDIFPLIEKTTESFPSGHATSATIFYGLLGLGLILFTKIEWKKIVICAGTFLLIGIVFMTRVYLGVHYPTDVIAGFLYGIGSVFISVGGYQLALRPLQRIFMRFKLTDHSGTTSKLIIRKERS
jgi:undecaprenyl-diphosphatase